MRKHVFPRMKKLGAPWLGRLARLRQREADLAQTGEDVAPVGHVYRVSRQGG
jgi:hypothetical protein